VTVDLPGTDVQTGGMASSFLSVRSRIEKIVASCSPFSEDEHQGKRAMTPHQSQYHEDADWYSVDIHSDCLLGGRGTVVQRAEAKSGAEGSTESRWRKGLARKSGGTVF
jgi:hypothetical protein